MSLIFAEPHKLFEAKLEDDEEILWIGEPKSKLWWLSLKRLFLLLVGGISGGSIVSLCLYLVFLFFNAIADDPEGNFGILIIGFYLFVPILFVTYHLFKAFVNTIDKIFEAALRKKYYAITNQRVLIYEYANVTNYSLILMADAIKHKPKRGRTTITLYDKTSYTGKMPKPIAKLNNLSEKDAEKAYELLKDAREDSFLERMAELEQEQGEKI